ncbi:MAG: hypothetical protein K5838_07640 [Elusimicrobiales bacterium]|nr:hypothetical protein [Elusimicrobiales bacterium]
MSQEKSGISIWILLSPLYILLLYPIYKIVVKNNSSDLGVDSKAFSVETGSVKKKNISEYQPALNYGGYGINYTAGDDEKSREEIGWGTQKGYLLAVLEKNSSDLTLLKELYNNKNMIRGFMSRQEVQEYLISSENIKRMLSNKKLVSEFLAEPGMKSLLSNNAAIKTILDSDFTKALVNENAAQDFMKDSSAIEAILTENRELVRLIKNPVIKRYVISEPATENLAKAVGWK